MNTNKTNFKDQCFYPLAHWPKMSEEWIKTAFGAELQMFLRPGLVDKDDAPHIYFTKSEFYKSKLVQDLSTHFGVEATGETHEWRTSFVKIPAGTCLDWHQDVCTGIKINWLLTDPKDNLTLWKYNPYDQIAFDFVMCEYEQYAPIIFNTHIDHIVINNSKQDRLLMNVHFPEHVKYDDAKEFLLNYQLTEY